MRLQNEKALQLGLAAFRECLAGMGGMPVSSDVFQACVENSVLAGRNKFFDSSMNSIVGSRGGGAEDKDQGGR